MKIFKELIPYLYQSSLLYRFPLSKIKSKNVKTEIPVIVSLTTIPSRIKHVHLSVRSMLLQKSTPKKIVLWLHEDLKSLVTKDLKMLEGDIFEICYAKIDCPHLKLIESLKKFPNLPIITIDDDQIYSPNLLQILYQSHLKKPNHIISSISRLIKFDEDDNPLTYEEWPYIEELNYEARFLLPLGVFGVLYPPISLNKEVSNMELITELSPKADDLWFKALSMVKGISVSIVGQVIKKPTMILGSQKVTLKKFNITQDNNRLQWKKLMDYFNFAINP